MEGRRAGAASRGREHDDEQGRLQVERRAWWNTLAVRGMCLKFSQQLARRVRVLTIL